MPLSNFRLHGIYYGMEILILVLLYYLSQNPDFLARVKPLMGEIKNSQELLKFITDLSKFSSVFSGSTQGQPAQSPPPPPKADAPKCEDNKKSPAAQTSGIADDFIQKCLENYFKKR